MPKTGCCLSNCSPSDQSWRRAWAVPFFRIHGVGVAHHAAFGGCQEQRQGDGGGQSPCASSPTARAADSPARPSGPRGRRGTACGRLHSRTAPPAAATGSAACPRAGLAAKQMATARAGHEDHGQVVGVVEDTGGLEAGDDYHPARGPVVLRLEQDLDVRQFDYVMRGQQGESPQARRSAPATSGGRS